MVVKIIKLSVDSYWYSGDIGKLFEVVTHDGENYRLVDKSHFLINKSDCEIVSVTETIPFKPRMMWVDDESISKAKKDKYAVFVTCIDSFGRCIGYDKVKSIEEINTKTTYEVWNFAVDIKQAPEFTTEQVAYLDKHYIKKN